MKKIAFVFCFVIIVFSTFVIANAQSDIRITMKLDSSVMNVNGVDMEIDPGNYTTPQVRNGRTLVPARAVTEAMGGTVNWDAATSGVSLVCNDVRVQLTIGSNVAYVNGDVKYLDVAPDVINNRTMLPIRFVAESFDFDVEWDGVNSQIIITSTDIADDGKLTVHFIDVGQGDAVFVQLPNSETMLVDAGPSQDVVNKYIMSLGYAKIDYVIATHPDSDHIGGMPQILQEFQVGSFYMPDKTHTTKLYETMIDYLYANGCDVFRAETGVDIFDFGDTYAKFVAPVKSYGDNNNSSAVIMLVHGEVSILLTGDAETIAEADILASGENIDADVLKVAHHGSDSSTSDMFLNSVTPESAVISVGADNRYGHPSEQVVSRLVNHGAIVYKTCEMGTITLVSDGVEYNVNFNADLPQLSADFDNTFVVYKTKTGKKYHLDGCSSLKSKIEITIADAHAQGLEPCSKCNPPR